MVIVLRLYIIGTNPSISLAVSNMVNGEGHVGIVSELKGLDSRGLASEIRMHVRDYDMVLAFSSDPADACIEANKMKEIRAAECRAPEDAGRLKRSSHINTVILDSGMTRASVEQAVAELISGSGAAQQPTRRPVEQKSVKPLFDRITRFVPQQQERPEPRQAPERAERPKRREERKQEEDEGREKPPKPGFVNKIKYTFGLD